jgi:hypothetical protein
MAIDIDTFTRKLRALALPPFGNSVCAKHVRLALEAGGANTSGHPALAREWGPTLLKIGFHLVPIDDPDTYPFRKGDVMVMEPYQGGNPAGHIAGFDGKNWISDFVQRDYWCGPGYRKERPGNVVYRP